MTIMITGVQFSVRGTYTHMNCKCGNVHVVKTTYFKRAQRKQRAIVCAKCLAEMSSWK